MQNKTKYYYCRLIQLIFRIFGLRAYWIINGFGKICFKKEVDTGGTIYGMPILQKDHGQYPYCLRGKTHTHTFISADGKPFNAKAIL